MRRIQIDMYRARCSAAVVLIMKTITDASPAVAAAASCEWAMPGRRQVESRS